jgi:branched-subunit amino acid transport protein
VSISLEALITILGMTAVTFAIRAGGLLLADRLPRTGFVAAWMKHIPAGVLVSLIAPSLISPEPSSAIGLGPLELYLKPAEAIAALATLGIYVLTKNLFAAMVGGVVAVFLARMVLGA